MNKYLIYLLVLAAVLPMAFFIQMPVTGMAVSEVRSGTSLVGMAAGQCGAPCVKDEKLGAKTLAGDCVEVERYMLSKYCCFDDDCPDGQKCDKKTETCGGTAPVAEIKYFARSGKKILASDPVSAPVTKDNGMINILFMPAMADKSVFLDHISEYMAAFVEQAALETGLSEADVLQKFNILYIEESVSCTKRQCNKAVMEAMPEYKDGSIDMVAILIDEGSSAEPHAYRNMLVSNGAEDFKHEIGHLFGLADEYSGGELYFSVNDYPNFFKDELECGYGCIAVDINGKPVGYVSNEPCLMKNPDVALPDVASYGPLCAERIKYVLDNLGTKSEIFKEVRIAMSG